LDAINAVRYAVHRNLTMRNRSGPASAVLG